MADKPSCGAKTRHEDGRPCSRQAGWGTDHLGIGRCKFHGGNTPNHRVAANNQVLDQQARAMLARLDVTPVDNPLAELATLAGQVVAFKDQLAGLVNKLNGRLRYEDAKGSEQLRSEVALFERALDRCNTVLGTMARLRIDERLAAINERQAEMVLKAIDMALDAVDVPAERRPDAKRAAARHLRVVS